MCDCCCKCTRTKTATIDIKKEIEQSVQSVETASFNSIDLDDNELKQEDFFFARPVKNRYSNNELYSMEIDEIYLCIHPTKYIKTK